MKSIVLKKGREASLLRHHPWIFSGAIERVDGNVEPGDVVTVTSHGGDFLGFGGYSPQSQIRVRMYGFDATPVDNAFFATKVSAAVTKRDGLAVDPEREAYRLIYGESDHLPGLIVDCYGDFLVCQFQFAGIERWKSTLLDSLVEATGCQGILERSDTASRRREGLPSVSSLVRGKKPPEALILKEYGLQLEVDLQHGQKTGCYLDQAENRRLIRPYCHDQEVLNCFAYTGAFSIAALVAGAKHVTSVDSSAPALAIAERNIQHNGLAENRHTVVEGKVASLLRDWQKQERRFDMVILDPPKFAEHKRQVMKASRAYKDVALYGSQLVNPGGLLVTFSCSGNIDLNLFQKITADALLDAGRDGEILQYLHQSPDHPVALGFPESQYLKGLICRVND